MAVLAAQTHSMVIKILNIVVLVGLAVFWVIQLAGVAKSQNNCVDALKAANSGAGGGAGAAINIDIDDNGNISIGRRRLLSYVNDCGIQYSLYWWITFFELACIVGAALLAFSSRLQLLRGPLVAFFVIVTTLLCADAHDFCLNAYKFRDSKFDDWKNGYAAGAAGAVGLLLFNFLWLILNTTDTASSTEVQEIKATEPRASSQTTAVTVVSAV